MSIQISEYKGKFSLLSGWYDKEGEFKLNWCRGKHFDKTIHKMVEDQKDTPVKIFLGSKEDAIEALQAVLDELMTKDGTEPGTDDIPF
jgi:hypothetical protein